MIKKAICQGCKEDFEFDLRPSRQVAKFCSHACRARFYFSGEKNIRWNGGRTTASNGGYIMLKAPNHPRATKGGYVREHRLVLEQHLGRYLLPSEDVHHINGVKTDNRIENLEVISSRSEHVRLEHQKGTYTEHLNKLNNKKERILA